MNTQVRTFTTDMALPGSWRDTSPHTLQLPAVRQLNQAPQTVFVSALWLTRGLLQVAALGIGIPAGLVLVLITVAKDGVTALIETHSSGKQP